MPDTTSTTSSGFVSSGLAGSLVSTFGGIGLTALQNSGKETDSKYQEALAQLNNDRALTDSQKAIALAKLNNDYAAQKATIDASTKKSTSQLVVIVAALAALTAIVIVLIVKRSPPVAVKPAKT